MPYCTVGLFQQDQWRVHTPIPDLPLNLVVRAFSWHVGLNLLRLRRELILRALLGVGVVV